MMAKKPKNSRAATKTPLATTEPKTRNKIREENDAADEFARLRVKTKHKIIQGDSSKMARLNSGSVHLIITSPPYYNAKSYSQWDDLGQYLDDMSSVVSECFRVLADGRKFCLNISDLPEKGESGVRWIPLGPKLLEICLTAGFELVDRIFWFKTPLKGFQYGSLPYPPSPLINDSVEYIYILRKPGKPDYRYASNKFKRCSRMRREEYVEYTKQVWSMRRVQIKDNIGGHIAPFPDELPSRCIKLYSFVGDVILDPFGGRGTTVKSAAKLKRNSVMYEKNGDFMDYVKDYVKLDQTTIGGGTPNMSFEMRRR